MFLNACKLSLYLKRSLMKKIFLIAAIACTTLACKDAKSNAEVQQEVATTAIKSEFVSLQQEAMEAHDAIMPKMGDLMKLKTELGLIDTAEPAIEAQKMDLQVAYDDMMSWMHSYSEKFPYGFELPADAALAEQKLVEMKEEHRKILELKDRTMKAIAQAEEILEQ